MPRQSRPRLRHESARARNLELRGLGRARDAGRRARARDCDAARADRADHRARPTSCSRAAGLALRRSRRHRVRPRPGLLHGLAGQRRRRAGVRRRRRHSVAARVEPAVPRASARGASTAASARSCASTRTWARSTGREAARRRRRRAASSATSGSGRRPTSRAARPARVWCAVGERLRGARGRAWRARRRRSGAGPARRSSLRPWTCCRRRSAIWPPGAARRRGRGLARLSARAHGLETQFLT